MLDAVVRERFFLYYLMDTPLPKPKKSYIKREFSRDGLSTFSYTTDAPSVYPDFSFDAALSLIDSDPIARGAMTDFIDSFMEGDYAILKRDGLKYDPEFESKLDKEYNFRHEVLRGFAIMGKFSKNVFVELVRSPLTKEVKALNVLDSRNIEVITKPNGDVIKYQSKVKDPINGRTPEWGPDEIVWYKLEDRKQGYATVDIKTLWKTLQAKTFVKDYVAWLFKTGQYRILYNFTNASDKDIQDTLAYMRRHEANFNAPFISKGEMESKVLRDMKELGDLTALIKYYDSETLVALRCPPIDAGIPDSSGRSNADAQNNAKSTHLTSMKKIFEDVTNYDLFPKMNKGNNVIRFGPNNRFEEKQIFENVASMVAANFSEDFIKEYLQDRGMFYASDKLFKTAEEMLAASGKESATGQSLNAPSRAKSVDQKKKGTGEAASTRAEQV